jgi:3-methyladenine DNA glycosylase AlkD
MGVSRSDDRARRVDAGIALIAARARRGIARLRRPAGEFDARRYFRGDVDVRFYNVGTDTMRAFARSVYEAHRGEWSVDEATAFAALLIRDPYLEVKSVGIEVVARYRRDFAPRLLPAWRGWLADNHSANWATTDAMCGALIGPLLVRHPALAPRMRAWARHRNMWVRRAAAVSLIPMVRTGEGLEVAYDVARMLHVDPHDLIQKAVGWMLREAGKADATRLERYLREHGASIPRTTVRYAIERFPAATRRALLADTKRAPKITRAGRPGAANAPRR